MTAPKTPLSDLLRGTSQPSAQPNRSPASPDPSPSSGVGGWVLAGLLAVVLIALTWQKFTPQPGPTPPDDQKREQVEPKPPTPQPKISGKTLIFIHERNPQSIEHDLLLREMPKYTSDNKLQFRAFDDDDTTEPIPAIIAWAKSKGIDPPFVVVTDQNDKPAKVIAWPSDIAGLGALTK